MERNELPVYQINSFHQEAPAHVEGLFDIKRIEQLDADFDCTRQPHRHDFYDLMIFTEGEGTHTIDFVEYEVRPCSVFFLTPGQVHAWELCPNTRGFSIFFEAEFFSYEQPLRRLKQMPFFHTLDASPVIYLSCEQSGFVHRTLNEMLEEYATPQVSSNQILRSYLEILLLKLTRFYTAEDAQYQSPYLLQQVSRYENLVEEHFIRHKSVQEYADMMAFTPKNLNAICKKAVGKTAGSIIKDRVLLEAKRLLMHSELSVNQIVAELNFKDPSYFVRFFRKNEGITPEQFRKRVLNGAYQGEANGLSSPHCAS